MFLIKKTAPNRIDIELSGPLDALMMRAGLDDLMEKSDGMKQGLMLYRIESVAMPTFGALMVEMMRLPSLFGLLGKFDKCAVLTDASWVQWAAEMEGAVLPGISIKSFGMAEEKAAEAWLAGTTLDDDEPNVPV